MIRTASLGHTRARCMIYVVMFDFALQRPGRHVRTVLSVW